MRIPSVRASYGRMLQSMMPGQGGPEERLVRSYLTALDNGRFLDALNAFSMDASFRDESGSERHGIREIAAAFARGERPVKVDIEDLRRDGDKVTVWVRMQFSAKPSPKAYRGVFHVERERIHSLEMDPLPGPRARTH